MHPKSPKWLQDIADACALIQRATQGRTFASYDQDALIRSAVERNFEIIGEALNRIRRTDPDTAARNPRAQRRHRLPQSAHSWLRRARSRTCLAGNPERLAAIGGASAAASEVRRRLKRKHG